MHSVLYAGVPSIGTVQLEARLSGWDAHVGRPVLGFLCSQGSVFWSFAGLFSGVGYCCFTHATFCVVYPTSVAAPGGVKAFARLSSRSTGSIHNSTRLPYLGGFDGFYQLSNVFLAGLSKRFSCTRIWEGLGCVTFSASSSLGLNSFKYF